MTRQASTRTRGGRGASAAPLDGDSLADNPPIVPALDPVEEHTSFPLTTIISWSIDRGEFLQFTVGIPTLTLPNIFH